MHSEPAPSKVQRDLLHGALKDLHYVREKLRGVALMQRYGGQPRLVAATQEIDDHLHRLWLLLDGLDPKVVDSSVEA